MDEVDNIIIHSLRQIGCKIGDDVISLSVFSPELLVETVSKCLQLIKPSLTLPEALPPGMAQRFSVTASLAEACASIGFRGDIGYQTFLYSNVSEIRKVFMFLIERLPKETEKLPLTQPLDKLTQLENEIYRNIRVQLSNAWIPQYCYKSGIRKFDSSTFGICGSITKFRPQLNLNIPHSIDEVKRKQPELYNYWVRRFPNIFQQTSSQTICASVIHKNDIEYYNQNYTEDYDKLLSLIILKRNQNVTLKLKSDIESLKINYYTKPINVTLPESDSRATGTIAKQNSVLLSKEKNVNLNKTLSPLDELNLYVEKLKRSIKDTVSARNDVQSEIQKMNELRIQHEKDLIVLKEDKRIKERTFILLENPEENLAKMEAIIAAGNERIKKLVEQWEEHRKPLLEALEKSKSRSNNSRNKNILDQIKIKKEQISEINEELKIKNTLYAQLQNECQKINKSTSRSAYTTRILEIIGNIRKQKNDIDKVLRDTRELQKQINNISGQLDRQFTVTDDLLYKTAKRDEHSKKAYKLLAKLHSDCSDLIELVQETGSIMREVRDLEDQIEKEKARNVLTNLEKITFDIKQMEKESKELQEKIRQVENQITQG